MARNFNRTSAAVAAALLIAGAALTGCGGGGTPTAEIAPPVVAQAVTALALSISKKDRTVLVNTVMSTDSTNAVAPVTETGAVTIDKVAYNVVSGVVQNAAGANVLLPLDVKTVVSATVHTGGQVLSKTVELTATCAAYTKNVGGNCLVDNVHAIVLTTVNGQSVRFFKRGTATQIAEVALPGTLSCLPSTVAHDAGVWVGCSVVVGAGVGHATFSVTPTGYIKVSDTSAAGTPEHMSSFTGWPVGCGGSSRVIDGGCLTWRPGTDTYDFVGADRTTSVINSWGGSVVF